MHNFSNPEPLDVPAQAKAAFFLRMRARGIHDLGVLRAFELIPRAFFVGETCQALAAKDVPLPLGCGQSMPEPWLLARMIEALRIAPSHHVLEVGAGSGYGTAILATLADDVIGVERFQTLALEARRHLLELDIANAAVVWGDGLELPPQAEAFDRIIAHGIVAEPRVLLDRLAPGGILVCARLVLGAPHAVAIEKTEGGVKETLLCPCRLAPLVGGVAGVL